MTTPYEYNDCSFNAKQSFTIKKNGGMGMLGERIAALRRKAGKSQAELAKYLGVSASAVGMYEQGRREPSGAMLVALGELFGVSTDYLLTGKTETLEDRAVERLLCQRLETVRKRISRRAGALSEGELELLVAAVLTNDL
jgi:transcriptional regulator with XRE-family HTH domain